MTIRFMLFLLLQVKTSSDGVLGKYHVADCPLSLSGKILESGYESNG